MKRFAMLSVPLLAMALLGAGCGPYQYEGSLYDPPRPLSGFSLPEAGGSTFNLSDYQGKVVLVFFGYSHCPDECPTTLAQLKQVMQKLGGDAAQVQVLFVTVDPERDTPDRLIEYLANFDSSFIGLRTTDSAQLQQVMSQFGAFAQIELASRRRDGLRSVALPAGFRHRSAGAAQRVLLLWHQHRRHHRRRAAPAQTVGGPIHT